MYLLNNLAFDPSVQRTIDDVQYPAGWFNDPAERAKIGVIEVPDPVRPDDTLYTVVIHLDGTYTATPRTADDLAARHAHAKTAFILAVKYEASALTRKILSGFESEYELAEKEATAYKAAGYPATSIPNSVQDEVASKAAKGVTVTATVACDTILAAAASWRETQAALRRNRLTTASAAAVTVDAGALDAVKEQWAGFLSALTAKLGLSPLP